MIPLDETQNRISAIWTCSCGHNFYSLPHDNKVALGEDYHEGIYFNCPCHSTCFIPKSIAIEKGLLS